MALTDYPSLTLQVGSDEPFIVGKWDVSFNGKTFETYEVRITFDSHYPSSLPKVYETSGKIAHDPDMHLNPPDWHACLFVSHQRWEIWPVGNSFKKFLEIPVHNFFLGQAHFAAHGYWPERRERSHGNQGIVEYYQEKFSIKNPRVIYDLLLETQEEVLPRQRKCPCNRSLRLKDCHGPIVLRLKANQDPSLLKDAISIFKTFAGS